MRHLINIIESIQNDKPRYEISVIHTGGRNFMVNVADSWSPDNETKMYEMKVIGTIWHHGSTYGLFSFDIRNPATDKINHVDADMNAEDGSVISNIFNYFHNNPKTNSILKHLYDTSPESDIDDEIAKTGKKISDDEWYDRVDKGYGRWSGAPTRKNNNMISAADFIKSSDNVKKMLDISQKSAADVDKLKKNL
jgi:hypothetical protein